MLQNLLLKNNKKGIAIELAIGFMVVTFALCTILTTVSLSTRIRDKNISEKANEYFMLDQAGDYFVKAVEKMGEMGEDGTFSEAYKKSVEDEIKDEQKELAALSKYTVDLSQTYTIKLFEQDKLNVDSHRFTMKIWNKKEFEAQEAITAGSGLNLPPLLIVSVDRTKIGRNVEYNITNWSDQTNQKETYVDATREIDHNSAWWWLFLLLTGLMLTTVLICIICIL